MEITTMTIEEAEKIGYVAKIKELYCELKSVWPTFSEKTRDNLTMLLGGLKDKSEVMALMGKEDDR